MHNSYTLLGIFLLGLLCMPSSNELYAAEVKFVVVSNIEQSDTATVIEARLDPEGVSLNAIDGMIGVLGEGSEELSSLIIETGGSGLSLWPHMPVYTKDDSVIRFAGGSPEGITKEMVLFRIRIFSKLPNKITMSWLGGSAYLGDGSGVAEGISSRSLNVSVSPSEPNQINASSPDSRPPVFSELEIARDEDIYEGKYFISFQAKDDVSGIAYYEVVEGRESTISHDGVYVLHDQERKTKVVVIAYDQAGNSTSIRVPTPIDTFFRMLLGGFALLVLLFVYLYRQVLFRIFRLKK